MFKFSRKMLYSIEAVLFIAIQESAGPVQSRAITRLQQIPERYLEQVLQRLVRVGVLRGVRGPKGGYQLARPAERIPLGEIVGVIRHMDGRGEDDPLATDLGRTVVAPIFERLDAEIMQRLDRISIADLIRDIAERQVPADTRLRELAHA